MIPQAQAAFPLPVMQTLVACQAEANAAQAPIQPVAALLVRPGTRHRSSASSGLLCVGLQV